jgi:hypothetical protein
VSDNGSGIYSVNSTGQPVVATTLIDATVFNAYTADAATAMSNRIAKDGQTTITADIPFNAKKITGLGAGTLRTDAASLATIQDGTGVYVSTVGGTADVITLTPTPVITAYAAGQTFRFIASGANTTNVTVAINGLTAKAITKNGTTALVAGDIPSGMMVGITYDGTQFILATILALPFVGGNMTGGINEALTTVASAATPDIFAITVGNTVNYTGTVTCTGFVASPQPGPSRTLVCAGAAPFTAGANMIIAGVASGQTYTCAVNDEVTVLAFTTTEFHLWIKKANGLPVVGTPISQFGKQIYGLTYSNGTDAVNDINFAAGGGIDSTNAMWITCAAMAGKQLDVGWAPGAAAGMRNSGAAIANTIYYLYAVAKADGTQDYYAHTSIVVATVITALQAESGGSSYVYARLIGYILRAAGTIVAMHTYETAGGGLRLMWDTPTLDVNLANTLTTSRRTDALKVPLNFSVMAHIAFQMYDSVEIFAAWIGCPDAADVAPVNQTVSCNFNADAVGRSLSVRTDIVTSATGTIAARASIATVNLYQVTTEGFTWDRRN